MNGIYFLSSQFDSLTITNENNETFGVYCGQWTGQNVRVTGEHAVITFHSSDFLQTRGFLILITAVPLGKYYQS